MKYTEKIIRELKDNKTEVLILITLSTFIGLIYLINKIYVLLKTDSFSTLMFSSEVVISFGITLSSTIFLLAYFIYNSRLVEKETKKQDLNINLVICSSVVFLAISSFSIFIKEGISAFTWPAIDMGPFLERYQDKSFAPNDFFTNASTLPSPRHIYGYIIISFTKLFNTDWYSVLHGLFVIFTITMPPLFFLTITAALRNRIIDDRRYLFSILLTLILILTIFIDKVSTIFSIGWWQPLFLNPAAQTLSLTIGLIYIFIAIKIRSNKSFLLIPILSIATTIHPAIGLFTFIFFILLDFDVKRLKFYFTSIILGVIIPIAIIAKLFAAETNFSAKDFIYHYIIENHSFHYLVSELGSFTNIPWYISFIFIIILFISYFYIGIIFKDSYLKKISASILLVYIGSVSIQYLFTEIIPIKATAAIGPIRFSMFAFWLFIFITSYILANYLPKKIVPAINKSPLFCENKTTIVTIIIMSLLLIIGIQHKDNPYQTMTLKYPGLIEWTERKTKPEDVFAVFPNFPPTHVPLLLKRGVFFGNGFPFTEDSFVEHNTRKAMIFGSEQEKKSFSDKQPWERTSMFYESLKPTDFLSASTNFRLDYIVVEKDFSSQFSMHNPVFENDKLKVYKVSDFMPKQ